MEWLFLLNPQFPFLLVISQEMGKFQENATGRGVL